MIRRVLIVAALLGASSVACRADPRADLLHAKSSWEAHHLSKYSFVLVQRLPIIVAGRDRAIFGPINIIVRNGKRLRATIASGGPSTDVGHSVPGSIKKYLPNNMDEIFNWVSKSLSETSGTREVVVTYDTTYGFPSKFSDTSSNTFDTDTFFEIVSFEATP